MTDLHKLGRNVVMIISLHLLKKGPLVILLYNTAGLTTVENLQFYSKFCSPGNKIAMYKNYWDQNYWNLLYASS